MSRLILEELNTAEQALRENLHRHDLDPTAREHMERALSHLREAYVATNETGKRRRSTGGSKLASRQNPFVSDLCSPVHPMDSSSAT